MAYTTESFIEKAKTIHGDDYDYSKVIYNGIYEPITITCKIHGDFEKTPTKHLSGQGCKICGYKRGARKQSLTLEQFTKRARKVHGTRYDYSKVKYKNTSSKVTIVCKEHGDFDQKVDNHLQGKGCPRCGVEVTRATKFYSTSGFIKRSREIHGDKYDYSKVEYKHNKQKVTIICPEHGEFKQTPDGHVRGHGCKKCTHITSKPEQEIAKFLSNFTTVVTSDRKLISPKELDIVLPDIKVAIEYNGLHWHSEKHKPRTYHRDKTGECNSTGYRLIHVWEDDYTCNPNKILMWLASVLNLLPVKPVGGRKCEVHVVDHGTAAKFHDDYHIQNSTTGTVHLGLFHDEILCSVVSYKKRSGDTYDLVRYTNRPGVRVIGGYAKLQSAFEQLVPECRTLLTFADLSWVDAENNTYEHHGFIADKQIPPDYKYVDDGIRKHKFGFRHEHLSSRLSVYDPELSEHCNCLNNRIYRIYDCGKIRYSRRTKK